MFKYQSIIEKILEAEKSFMVFDVASIYRWKDQKKLRWNMADTQGTTDPVEIVTLAKLEKHGDAWRITFASFEALEAFREEGIDYKQPIQSKQDNEKGETS